MPRNVRNFWIDLNVDGRKASVNTGPRRKDGGFRLSIKMRRDGDIFSPVFIEGLANPDGTLKLMIAGDDGVFSNVIEVKR